jgi:MFS family permease
MLHLAFARAPVHIAAAAFLLGVLGDLYRPAVSAAIADLVPPGDRVRAFGLLYWAVNLGFAVGSALGGALAARGWYLLFFGDAATTLLYAGIVWWKIPETRPAHLEHEKRTPPWAPFGDGRFVAFCALNTAVWMLFLQAFVTLPIDVRSRGLSPSAYGLLIALNGVLIVLLQPVVSRLLARFAHHRVLAFAALLVGAGFGLTSLMTTVQGFAVAITVWSLGEIVMAGIDSAVAADAAPERLRGAYQGFLQMGIGAAALLAPILGSQIMGRFGAVTLWTCCLGVGLLTALGQLALGTLRPRSEPATAP